MNNSLKNHITLDQKYSHLESNQPPFPSVDSRSNPLHVRRALFEPVSDNLRSANSSAHSDVRGGQLDLPSMNSRSDPLHVRQAHFEPPSIDGTSAYLNLSTHPNHADLNVRRAPCERTFINASTNPNLSAYSDVRGGQPDPPSVDRRNKPLHVKQAPLEPASIDDLNVRWGQRGLSSVDRVENPLHVR